MKFKHLYPRLEVIETGVGVEVIAAVAEGIELRVGVRAGAVVYSFGAVAPRVVGVGDNFRSRRVVDGDHVSLDVFLEEEHILHSVSVGVPAVGEADRQSILVVSVDKLTLNTRRREPFGHYPASAQYICV